MLALALALRSMHAISALTLTTFDANLLAAALGMLTHLTLLADKLPYASFDDFLATFHNDVSSAAVPRLAVLDSSPGLTAALARSWPSTALCDATHRQCTVRPAPLFGALGTTKGTRTRTRAGCGMRTRGQLMGALGNTRAVLQVLDLSLEGTSDEVSHQALYKQVGSLLPNVQVLQTLRLRASLPTEVAIVGEGPSRLALWTRPPLGLALRCVVLSFLWGRIGNLSRRSGYA
ncbi:hypothetical protein EDB86DRAFT_2830702 [Lactarius hatsudake]|nr:hypothetical protein EDB86DRAFT_2830702 [Lactarius hatsudake]